MIKSVVSIANFDLVTSKWEINYNL